MTLPRAELTAVSRVAKCRMCEDVIPRGQKCYVIRDIHVSPKIVDLFFHIECWPDFSNNEENEDE